MPKPGLKKKITRHTHDDLVVRFNHRDRRGAASAMHIDGRKPELADFFVKVAVWYISDKPVQARLLKPGRQVVQFRALMGQDNPVVPGFGKVGDSGANPASISARGIHQKTDVNRFFQSGKENHE